MFSFRYHLASLTAVFLALGLGLVIGASLADSGTLGAEQWSVIAEIETRLGELRGENLRLGEELARQSEMASHYNAAWVHIGTEWIDEALWHRKIALFGLGDQHDLVESVRSLLRSVGAQVTPILLYGGDVEDEVADALARFLLGQEISPPVESLIAQGALATGASLVVPDAIVIIGSRTSSLPERIAEQLAAEGVPGALGVPGRPADGVGTGNFSRAGYVDTPAGQLYLAWLTARNLNGATP